MDAALAQSPTLISLHWLPPPSVHINGRFQYYLVNITETNTGRKWTFSAVDTVLRVGSLHPDYVYAFTITARTIGNGPYSPLLTVRTRQDGTKLNSQANYKLLGKAMHAFAWHADTQDKDPIL